MARIIKVEVRKTDERRVAAKDVDEVIIRTPGGTFTVGVDNSGYTFLRVPDGLLLIQPEGGNSIHIAQTFSFNWDKF